MNQPPFRCVQGQGNGYIDTNEWNSGYNNRTPQVAPPVAPSSPEKGGTAEEQRALEQARLERELLEKRKQEEAIKREMEREAERERLRVEEEKKIAAAAAAAADLQKKQLALQTQANKQEEKWERVKLPPSPVKTLPAR